MQIGETEYISYQGLTRVLKRKIKQRDHTIKNLMDAVVAMEAAYTKKSERMGVSNQDSNGMGVDCTTQTDPVTRVDQCTQTEELDAVEVFGFDAAAECKDVNLSQINVEDCIEPCMKSDKEELLDSDKEEMLEDLLEYINSDLEQDSTTFMDSPKSLSPAFTMDEGDLMQECDPDLNTIIKHLDELDSKPTPDSSTDNGPVTRLRRNRKPLSKILLSHMKGNIEVAVHAPLAKGCKYGWKNLMSEYKSMHPIPIIFIYRNSIRFKSTSQIDDFINFIKIKIECMNTKFFLESRN